ncbi:TonB-dependent receptor [Vibrio ponticus]|uniref:TonB-dependent receptor n=1 Tax=Vibrio ponticus TaxID=265668 RepID=A0ABX3FF61_9VIBR|nr:TonB-dependent receptor [Vibrio ponticus]OLQ89236.1 TonB-dependent receptor [Vibrio ponticus]
MRYPIPFIVSSAILFSPISSAEFDLDALLDMPLDSLADTKVVSATRTAQSLSDIAASVYVITAKEINRSGVRSVADALALAPGLHVAKYSNYDWGITARGQNKPLSNTLLVMVDGRSVFNPMFSGVDWDLIPVSLDNIAQIEVVLGPVGTIWGGNATNGVINIITQEAEKTPRGKLTVKEGNYHYSEYQIHDSTEIGEYANLSGYFEYVDHMPWTSEEERVQIAQHFNVYTERFGARLDYQKFADTLSIQVGGIRSREDYQWIEYLPIGSNKYGGDPYDTEMTMQEYFAGLQHIHDFQNSDSWDNKVWLTYSSNDGPDRNANFWRLDLDSHYTIADLWGTQLSIGGNIRLIDEKLGKYSEIDQFSMPYLRVTDDHEFFSQNYGLYANWDIELGEKTHLTLGNRWQYHNLTDKVYAQPQARVSYNLASNQRVWAGWGRAVVTPSRLEMDTTFQQNMYKPQNDAYEYIGSMQMNGNDNMDVEKIETFELGYRFWQGNQIQLSLSGYYSRHDNIRAGRQVYPESPQDKPVDGIYVSQYEDPLWSETMGGEIALKWQPLSDVQLNTNYSYKRIVGHCKGALCAGSDVAKRQLENQPNHFVNAQLIWDINPQWWVSSTMHYVGKSSPHPDYTTNQAYEWPEVISFDASASWQLSKQAPRLTLSAENLGAEQSKEFAEYQSPFQNGTQYWLTLEWQYGALR